MKRLARGKVSSALILAITSNMEKEVKRLIKTLETTGSKLYGDGRREGGRRGIEVTENRV